METIEQIAQRNKLSVETMRAILTEKTPEQLEQERAAYVVAFSVTLTPKEKRGIENCSGGMWDSYFGGIVRRAGQQVPMGLYNTSTIGNQLVVKVPPTQ